MYYLRSFPSSAHITVKIFLTFHNLQTSEGEKESDQSTQSLDLGFPDDDDEPPQQEGETNYPKVPHRGTVLLLAASLMLLTELMY